MLMRTICVALLVLLLASPADADWTRFRGPNGDGVTPGEAPLPAEFSATTNLGWKTKLPGPGSSSPVVLGPHVYITCWSGYGAGSGSSNDQKDLRRHLLCLDRKTGSIVWDRQVEPVLPEDRFGGMFAQHGYASHTPVTDGQRVYVFFGKSGALAFDLDGKQLWQTSVGTGTDPRGWGSACSPILYKNLLIVTASAESESLVALDKETGSVVWRQQAGGLGSTWGTPILVEVDSERTDLVLGVPYEIWGLNPETGKLRWYCQAMDNNSYCSSVIASGGVVYGIEGQGGGSIAVRAGGKGDVTDSHVLWSGRDANRIGTPVSFRERIYFFSNGIANCIDSKTGKRIFQSRLQAAPSSASPDSEPPAASEADAGGRRFGGPGGGRGGFGGSDYSSPIVADGKVIFARRGGDIFVLRASDKFEQLAVNRLTNQPEDFSASPAASDGQLFIRSSIHLYCVQKAEVPATE